MSVVIHFKDPALADANIASGIDAGPYTKDGVVDNGIIQIVNSSVRVAIVPADIVKFLDIVP